VSGQVLVQNLKLTYQLPGEASSLPRSLSDGQTGYAAQVINSIFFDTGSDVLKVARSYIGSDYPTVGQVKDYPAVTFAFSSAGMVGIDSLSMKAGQVLAERTESGYTLYLRSELSLDGTHFFPFWIQAEFQGLSADDPEASDTLVRYRLGDTRGKCQVSSAGTFTSYYPDAPGVGMTKGIVTLTNVDQGKAFNLVFGASGNNFAAFGDSDRVVVRHENGDREYFLHDKSTPEAEVPASDLAWLTAHLPARSDSWSTYGGAGSVWAGLFEPAVDNAYPLDAEFSVLAKLPSTFR